MTASVVDALAEAARRARPCRACGAGPAHDAVLADRPDATVVRHGPVVAKAHAGNTDPGALAVRLAVAAHPLLDGILLAPLDRAARAAHGRPVTLWPYGSPVDPDGGERAAPWEEAGRLLARLHRIRPDALPGPLPPARGPAKSARALDRMRAAAVGPGAAPVLRAWAQLPAWARAEAPAPGPARLTHGDFHLGRLMRHPDGAGPWTLIDIDDLGLGAPAWDLAGPAAWFAAGLLAPGTWVRFLAAYRDEGGPAVPAAGDPWPQLDVPARALTVQAAAQALAKCAGRGRPADEAERAMLESCTRIAAVQGQLGHFPT
ncbi:phosphotransferase family protein [Streptomyces mauvecolor]|uniref:Phosphotransferase family protein n=1 Tax=Streptomyces mauvecolor TaxID=58345 RepID=A0ABV9UGZ5_9ACTN